MSEGIRLQKYMADNGLASRRASEKLILDGKVTVNGKPAELGMKVTPSDIVLVDGKKVMRHSTDIYLMMNKPRGYITTMSDELGRKCVTDLITDVKGRVVPVGRLDRDSEGLLIMTSDGDLVYRLTHPKHTVPKIYTAVVAGHPTQKQIEMLNSPMEIDGYTTDSSVITVLSQKDDRTSLRFELYEGRNRQIRKMCELAGLDVLRLKRVAYGELRLAEVKSGKWRYLTEDEVEYLKNL